MADDHGTAVDGTVADLSYVPRAYWLEMMALVVETLPLEVVVGLYTVVDLQD